MEKTITITIGTNGNVNIEASGYTGGSCVKATQPLKDQLIGEQPTNQALKPEYNRVETRVAERLRQ